MVFQFILPPLSLLGFVLSLVLLIYAPDLVCWAIQWSPPHKPVWLLAFLRQIFAVLAWRLEAVQCAFKSRMARSLRYRHDPPLYGLCRAFSL